MIRRYLSFPGLVATLCLILVAVTVVATQAAQQPSIKQVPAQRMDSVEGPDIYREYCSVCHGSEGKGNGPAAVALKTPLPDLTTITKRHGKFPSKDVEETITGQNQPMPAAHGTREMPMWGPVFRGLRDRDVATLAVANLIAYLQSIQVK